MNLRAIGEFGLIEQLQKKIKTKNKEVIYGIGDDCAVILKDKKTYQIITTDMLAEDIHFSQKYFSPYQIGYKSVAVNFSDISSMGGIPKYILVSIGLNKNISLKFVDELFKGIKHLCNKFGVDIIGGDTISSKKMVINIVCIGEVKKENLILRSGAKVGDIILVTGYLGNSRCGLEILKKSKIKNQKSKTLIKSHLAPAVRIKEVQEILKACKVNSMIDISDGLSGDILKLAKASKVGVRIYKDKIPISKECKKFCKENNLNYMDIALSGGEDYELVFTVEKKNLEKYKKLPFKITEIGEIINKKEGYLIVENDKTMPLVDKSFNHFSSLP